MDSGKRRLNNESLHGMAFPGDCAGLVTDSAGLKFGDDLVVTLALPCCRQNFSRLSGPHTFVFQKLLGVGSCTHFWNRVVGFLDNLHLQRPLRPAVSKPFHSQGKSCTEAQYVKDLW